MVKLIEQLSCLKKNKILLAGDLMLDRYTIGKASRISPEAPVPVLLADSQKTLPGGAGNVALGLLALKQDVVLLGRIGDDSAGNDLMTVLKESDLDTSFLSVDASFQTPVKNRLIADRQQMLRIDHERVTPLADDVQSAIIQSLPKILEGISLVALSDYGKGFLTETLIQAIIEASKERGIPVVIDPKGIDFRKYRGAYLVKPNLKEAYAAAKATLDTDLNQVAEKLLNEIDVEKLMVTRSEEGITVFDKTTRLDFPVSVKEIVDVTGAGDTVLSMLAASLASGLDIDKAISLCNVAASLALEHVGCYTITLDEISNRLLDDHAQDKFIEKLHAPALVFALKERPHTIFELTDEAILDPALYEKIRALKTSPNHTVVMSLNPSLKSHSFAQMLASLKEVDFILKN